MKKNCNYADNEKINCWTRFYHRPCLTAQCITNCGMYSELNYENVCCNVFCIRKT